MPFGSQTLLQPGEIYEFVYMVEKKAGAVPLAKGLSFLSPATVSWCTSESEEVRLSFFEGPFYPFTVHGAQCTIPWSSADNLFFDGR